MVDQMMRWYGMHQVNTWPPHHRPIYLLLSLSISQLYLGHLIVAHKDTSSRFAMNRPCQWNTFEIYDGYELSIPHNTVNTQNYFHFTARSLQACLNLCAKNANCEGINYNGNTCQQLEQSSVLEGRLIRSVNQVSFNIYGHKICINGMAY